ncbi:MAG: hypothetical protein QOF51_930 [Chloroflexota bacterium]|jgi:ribose 1,5-bisphosphate isomerase|nr:hypothetical protein [Chloroflexota bacterium]
MMHQLPGLALAELATDHLSGATTLAERAAEALIDIARAGDRDQLEAAAVAAVRAAPAMAPVARVAAAALRGFEGGGADGARRAVRRARSDAERERRGLMASAADRLLPGVRVLTHSASSLVRAALLEARARGTRFSVTCLESRPLCEGADLARELAAAGIPTALAVDAAMGIAVGEADLVLIGADTLAPRGLVHKIGTWPLCLAAGELGVPILVLADSSKLLPALIRGALEVERAAAEVADDVPTGLAVTNRAFDVTPLDLLDGVLIGTELLDADDVAARARRIRLPAVIAAELEP